MSLFLQFGAPGALGAPENELASEPTPICPAGPAAGDDIGSGTRLAASTPDAVPTSAERDASPSAPTWEALARQGLTLARAQVRERAGVEGSSAALRHAAALHRTTVTAPPKGYPGESGTRDDRAGDAQAGREPGGPDLDHLGDPSAGSALPPGADDCPGGSRADDAAGADALDDDLPDLDLPGWDAMDDDLPDDEGTSGTIFGPSSDVDAGLSWGTHATAAPHRPSVLELFPLPSFADANDPEEVAAMLAAGEDPEAMDPDGRTRPRHPVHPLTALAVLRLAATFGGPDAWRAALRPGAITVVDAGNVEAAEALGRVLRDRLLPGLPPVVRRASDARRTADAEAPRLADGTEPAFGPRPQLAPALVLVDGTKADLRTGAWDPTLAAATISDALASSLPVLALLPEPRRLDADLRAVLPRPLPLAPFSREVAFLLLAATHSATGRVTAPEVLRRLPSDRGLHRLPPPALLVALREPTLFCAAEALARLAGEAPQGACGSSAGPGAGTDAPTTSSGVGPAHAPSTASAAAPLSLDLLGGMGALERTARLIVTDLEAYAAGEATWEEITRSVLLFGEPGTGKTFAAQVIAEAAGCAFVTTSLAKMQSKGHLGDLLREMRRVVAEALARAPSILFIDEVDAFGSRDDPDPHNASYRAQVITGLLECLDGVDGREGVVVLAACNNPGRLDPALRRPGRFDLTVEVPRPGPAGLARVLGHHLTPELARAAFSDADVAALLPHARGRTPAEVDAAVRSARSAARGERRALAPADVAAALAPAVVVPAAVVRRAALHEAGHAVVTVALDLGRPARLTLTPGGGGWAEIAPSPHEGTAERWKAEAARLLAGREAERLVLGSISGGAGESVGLGSDLERASGIAASLEMSFGLGPLGPLWAPADWRSADRETRLRIRAHLAAGEARARRVLAANRAALLALADQLAAERVVEGEMLDQALAAVQAEESDDHGQPVLKTAMTATATSSGVAPEGTSVDQTGGTGLMADSGPVAESVTGSESKGVFADPDDGIAPE